jgi:IS30 family transposase
VKGVIKHRHFSLEEKQKLEQMIKSGLTRRECAHLLGRSFASVKAQVKRGGGMYEYSAELSEKKIEEGKQRQKTKVTQFFSEEAAELIDKMKAQGKSLRSIADTLQCSRQRIRRHFEKKGEECPVDLSYTTSIKDRLYCLEQTLEIVLEELENLKRRN